MFESLVRNGSDLRQWFFDVYRMTPFNRDRKLADVPKVTTAIRNEILRGDKTDRITIEGRVRRIKFEFIGGGLWRPKLDELTTDPTGGQGNQLILSTSVNKRYKALMTPITSNYNLGSFLFSLGALSSEQEELLKKGGQIKVKIVEVARVEPPEEED
jgi:hypothetical protein